MCTIFELFKFIVWRTHTNRQETNWSKWVHNHHELIDVYTAQNMKFSIKDFFSNVTNQ